MEETNMGIVIIEGATQTRKSTLSRLFEQQGYIYLKDLNRAGQTVLNAHMTAKEWYQQQENVYDRKAIINRLDALTGLLIELDKHNINVVVDRFHISEKVYSQKRNGYSSYIEGIDTILSLLDTSLVILYDKEKLDNDDEETKLFIRAAEKSKISKKYICDSVTVSLDNSNIVNLIEKCKRKVTKQFRYDFYLASPFFNETQIERMEYILKTLRKNGYCVFAPYESGVLAPDATDEDRNKIFNSNIKAIENSESILCITDGKDIGTIWEAGYGKALDKKIVYFCETLGSNPFNVMLAKSANSVYTSRDVFDVFAQQHNLISGKEYSGDVQ